MTIDVRPARQADHEQFLDLFLARLEPGHSTQTDRAPDDPVVKERASQARRALDPRGRAATLVAENENWVLTGYIMLSIHEPGVASTEGTVPTGRIEEFYVAADHRDSGSATALMNAAEAWFRSRNVPRIKVEAFARDEDAIAYYQRLGYRVSDVILTKWL